MRKKTAGKQVILLTGILFIISSNLFSQVVPSYIDISKIDVSKVIKDSMQVYITSLETDIKDSLPNFKFQNGSSTHCLPCLMELPGFHLIIIQACSLQVRGILPEVLLALTMFDRGQLIFSSILSISLH